MLVAVILRLFCALRKSDVSAKIQHNHPLTVILRLFCALRKSDVSAKIQHNHPLTSILAFSYIALLFCCFFDFSPVLSILGHTLSKVWTFWRNFDRIGEPLGNHWGTIGEPLGNHWGTIGEPLGNHWGTIGEPLGNLTHKR